MKPVEGAHEAQCKSCPEYIEVTDVHIQRMVNSLQAKNFDCVSDDMYQQRLVICSHCPSLGYKNTCMHCGCIVQVRAKFKDKHCPFPGDSKW